MCVRLWLVRDLEIRVWECRECRRASTVHSVCQLKRPGCGRPCTLDPRCTLGRLGHRSSVASGSKQASVLHTASAHMPHTQR
eukprot:7429004-Pyramimonas_sp.AAC.1